jgi:hypothetical protein
MSKTETTPAQENMAGIIIGWLLGILFGSIGVFSLLNLSPVPSAVMFCLTFLVLPPTTKLLYSHYKFHLSGRAKLVAILAGFLVFSLSVKQSDLDAVRLGMEQKNNELIQSEPKVEKTPIFTLPETINTSDSIQEPTDSMPTDSEAKPEELAQIKADCEALWGTDFKMQAFCRDKQLDAVAQWNGMVKPEHVSQENYEAIRQDCINLWGSDFKMRVFCTGKQFDALLTL